MDIACDHIQEEILSTNDASKSGGNTRDSDSSSQRPNLDLNAEFQETFRAFSNSPWGMRLGGLWNNVRRQGESYYEGARQEYAAASEEAVKGFSDLRNSIVGRTRGLSLGSALAGRDGGKEKDNDAPELTSKPPEDEKPKGDTEEGETFISRFRSEAVKRLKDIERAEDAADEALLRFGTNLRNFLRDAVSIAPPVEDESSSSSKNKVLFESKDPDGKRVFHATRFEAQLHVIHTNLDSFTEDPGSDEWPTFQNDFKVESKTDEISKDLEAFPELRRTMETLVPEKVEYADFWCRYYFLRLAIETEERKRRDLLQGASKSREEDEITWDEDSDLESPPTPQNKFSSRHNRTSPSSSRVAAASSSSPRPHLLKPGEPRRSNDQQSQPDSEFSYDLVSGTTSRAPESPREKPASGEPSNRLRVDESDEEDWE